MTDAEPDTTDHAALAAELTSRSQDGGDGGTGNAESPREAEARKHGWMSPEEREADPKYAGQKHRTADEFLEIMEDRPAVHKERNKALQAKLDNIERTTSVAIQRIEAKLRAEYDAKFEQRLEEATLQGDTAAVKKLVKERESEGQTDNPTGAPPEVEAWVQKNPWFKDDRDLFEEAVLIDNRLQRAHPAMSIPDRLEKVREEVAKRNPDKFGAKANDRPAATNLSDGARLAPRTSNLADKLPAVARQIADKLIKDGAFKTREEYAKVYFADEPERARA